MLTLNKIKRLINAKIKRNEEKITYYQQSKAIELNVNSYIYKHKNEISKNNKTKINILTKEIIELNNASYKRKKNMVRNTILSLGYPNIRFYNNFLKLKQNLLNEKITLINFKNTNMETNNNKNIKLLFNKDNYKLDKFVQLNNSNIDEYFQIQKFGNKENVDYNKIYDYLIEYLIDPYEDNSQYIYYENKIIQLLKISLILLNCNDDTIELPPNRKSNGKGGWASIFFNNNKQLIKKYESLRFHSHEKRKAYTIYNYVPSQIFITMIIHNFLYNLNHDYVPQLFNISISYKNDLSLTIMENAFSNITIENYVFQDYIINQTSDMYYVENILLFLYRISEILDFYQKRCYLVHSDFHPGNILISFQRIENTNKINIPTLNIKIIDFQFSSIIFFYNNKCKILRDVNMFNYRKTDYINPLISDIWNKVDLITLIIKIFISPYYNTKYEYLKDNENYKKLLLIISSIFNYNSNKHNTSNYLYRYNELKKIYISDISTFFSIIKSKKNREYFFNYEESKDICKNYIPFYFMEEIKSILKI